MTPSLRELQQAFAAGVYEEAADALAYLHDGAFPAQRHLQIYRNNTFTSLTDALAAIYPVVQRLVGADFFGQAARHYLRQHPPTSGNLHDVGATLADFLSDFAPAQTLAYLPDVARLEWAWHCAFHAADAAALPLTTLAAVPPEKYSELKFDLHPSARLLCSPYPLFRIWQVNQPGFTGDDTVRLENNTDYLLVIRRGLETQIEQLEPGEYALLASLKQAHSLITASSAATGAEPAFDLMQTLQRHIHSATLVAFHF